MRQWFQLRALRQRRFTPSESFASSDGQLAGGRAETGTLARWQAGWLAGWHADSFGRLADRLATDILFGLIKEVAQQRPDLKMVYPALCCCIFGYHL